MSVAVELTDVERRVLRGAALLDEKRPGWWNDIDLGHFQMTSYHSCILGQLFGVCECGYIALGFGEDWKDSFDCGFFTPGNMDDPELRSAWVELVTDRRSGVAS